MITPQVPGACWKHCHAVECDRMDRHGCHDGTCLKRFGFAEICGPCLSVLRQGFPVSSVVVHGDAYNGGPCRSRG